MIIQDSVLLLKKRFNNSKKPNDKTTNASRRGNCIYVSQSPILFCLTKKYADKINKAYNKLFPIAIPG